MKSGMRSILRAMRIMIDLSVLSVVINGPVTGRYLIMSRLLQSHSGPTTNFLQIPKDQPPYNPNKMGQAVSLATFGYVAASQIYHHLMTADSTIDVSGGIVQDPYEVAVDQMYPRFHSRMLMAKGAQDDPHLDWDAESMINKIRADDVIKVAMYPNAANGEGNVKVVILDPSGTEYPRFYRLKKNDLMDFHADMETKANVKFNGDVFVHAPRTSDDHGDEIMWMAVPDDGSTRLKPLPAQDAESMLHEIKTTNVMEVKLIIMPGITSDHANVACTTLGADGINISRFYILKEQDLMQLLDLMQADEGFKPIPSEGDISAKVFGKVVTATGKVENIVDA